MNRKDKGIDAARILKAESISAVAIATVRDKHVVHHQNMGGSCYVYLDRKADLPRAVELLKATPGVTEIYEGAEAARLFQLYPSRVGDLLLLAAKDTVFGNLDQPLQEVKVRSHGSRFRAGGSLAGVRAKSGHRCLQIQPGPHEKAILE